MALILCVCVQVYNHKLFCFNYFLYQLKKILYDVVYNHVFLAEYFTELRANILGLNFAMKSSLCITIIKNKYHQYRFSG